MKTKTKSKLKTKNKHDYYFLFKRGDYIEVSNRLDDQYSKMFRGSGINLMDGIYDIHFKCTADQKRNIMAFINRNYGKIIKKITRKDKNGYYE